ncbi:dihydrofolate reductase family protein [Nocardia africana]|uniref:RibD C-terminal domain n=1 Tax=Nocardia africana TaxID=134964 RepID=A0A378WJ05_9NOCA|nr:dihydrofolate reductase family protein [Nocardia africana]MCC3316378.1 dihydrofolate reductase family protein [Nocardia africana]SUA41270.1 RibD C-terminal domain [Nocardia africana]
MRKLIYFVGVSLDGYIAGPGGEYDFYPVAEGMSEFVTARYPESVPAHLRPHVGMAVDEPNKEWDTILMGRGTYEPALSVGIASPYPHLKQYVVSATLDRVDDPQVELVPRDPVALVRRLKQEDGKDIWLCGGGQLAGALVEEIDALIIKSYPVVAGGGISAFTGNFRPTAFTPVQRREFGNGAQITWFERG